MITIGLVLENYLEEKSTFCVISSKKNGRDSGHNGLNPALGVLAHSRRRFALRYGDKTSAMEQYGVLKETNSILAAQLLKQIGEAK